jgi:hypothetical protein
MFRPKMHPAAAPHESHGLVVSFAYQSPIRPQIQHASFREPWYGKANEISNAIDYVKFDSPSHDAVIRVYDSAGTVIKTHEHAGESKEW